MNTSGVGTGGNYLTMQDKIALTKLIKTTAQKLSSDLNTLETEVGGQGDRITQIEMLEEANGTLLTDQGTVITGNTQNIQTNTDDITDLTTRITTVEGLTQTVTGRVDTLESGFGEDIHSLFTTVQALQIQDQTTNTQVDNLQQAIGLLNTQVQAIQEQDTDYDSAITNIQGLQQTQQGQLTGIYATLSDDQTRLTTVETVNTTQNIQLSDHETRITTLETQITNTGGTGNTSDTLDGLTSRVSTLEYDMGFYYQTATTVTQGQIDLQNDTQSNTNRITTLEQYQQNVISPTFVSDNTHFDAIDGRIGDLQSHDTVQDASLSNLWACVGSDYPLSDPMPSSATIRNRLATLESNIASLSYNVTVLQGQMATANGNITTNSNSIITINNGVNANTDSINQLKTHTITQTNKIRTGTVTIGDVGSSVVSGFTGAINTATVVNDTSSSTTLTITYDDMGYVPNIFIGVINNLPNNANRNDFVYPEVETNSNTTAKIYIEETNGVVQAMTYYLLLIQPNMIASNNSII